MCFTAILVRKKCCGPVWILLLINEMFIRLYSEFLHVEQHFNSIQKNHFSEFMRIAAHFFNK